jgi:uncharacterized protein (DUF433 family)
MEARNPASYRNYKWIRRDSDLLRGKVAVRGTRSSVSFVLACLAERMSAEENTDTSGAFPKEAIGVSPAYDSASQPGSGT